jgi:hypothetical protein
MHLLRRDVFSTPPLRCAYNASASVLNLKLPWYRVLITTFVPIVALLRVALIQQ